MKIALSFLAGKEVEGLCACCNSKTELHGPGSTKLCTGCYYIKTSKIDVPADNWRIGCKVYTTSIKQFQDGDPSFLSKAVNFLADVALIWAGATEVKALCKCDAVVAADGADGQYMTVIRTCKFPSSECLTMMQAMNGDNANKQNWNKAVEQMPASSLPVPGFRARPHVMDPSQMEATNYRPFFVDEASKTVILTMEAVEYYL